MTGAKGIVRRGRQTNRTTHFSDFAYYGYVFEIAQARTAVLCRNQHAHKAQFAHLVEKLYREGLAFIPLHQVGAYVFIGKVTDHFRDLNLRFGLIKIHSISFSKKSA